MESGDHGPLIGTTTAGFALESGHIILGSDKEKGNPSGKKKLTDNKVYPLGKEIELQLPQAYTRAGYEKDVDFMRSQLDAFVQIHRESSDINQMPDYVLRKVLESEDKISGNHKGHLILGGYNKGFAKPHLYYINCGGVLDLTKTDDILEINNRFQSGSGRGAAFIILNERYDPKMSLEEGKILIQDAIYNAINHDEHTGKGIEYIVISPDGVSEKEVITIAQYERKRRH